MADPGFLRGGTPTPEKLVKTYYLATFLPKTAGKFKNLDRVGRVSLATPLRSANVIVLEINVKLDVHFDKKGFIFSSLLTVLAFLLLNGTGKMKLAILVILNCGEIVKNHRAGTSAESETCGGFTIF